MNIDTIGSPTLWGGFILFVLAMLALDLGVFQRKEHVIKFKEAAFWSLVWVSLSLLFCAGLYWKFGSTHALEFLTGYLIEKSLSVDNIFVFLVAFQAMKIPALYQHRVLFWGILGALILRAAMIVAGVALLERFHWIIYVFGVFLIITGIKLMFEKDHGEEAEEHPEDSRIMKFVRRMIPSTRELHGHNFFTVENGKRLATPLFMSLIIIELSDVVFALDSIPAIFAVTRDPFIVFTSNIFAILGLRSMFFLLAGLVDKFAYLKYGISAVLVFVGVKMLIVDHFKIPSAISLGVIALLLGGSIAASWMHADKEEKKAKT